VANAKCNKQVKRMSVWVYLTEPEITEVKIEALREGTTVPKLLTDYLRNYLKRRKVKVCQD
jgi:hypothetical protein